MVTFFPPVKQSQRCHCADSVRLPFYLTDIQHVRVAEQSYRNINLFIVSLVSCRWGLKNIDTALKRFAALSNALVVANLEQLYLICF